MYINLSPETLRSMFCALICVVLLVAGFKLTGKKKGGGNSGSSSTTSNEETK